MMDKKGIIIGSAVIVAVIAGIAASYTSETSSPSMERTHGTISTVMGPRF